MKAYGRQERGGGKETEDKPCYSLTKSDYAAATARAYLIKYSSHNGGALKAAAPAPLPSSPTRPW